MWGESTQIFTHAHRVRWNCCSTAAGWIEWGYQSFNAHALRTKGMTQGAIDYLMWHHFGRNPEERNHDLYQVSKFIYNHIVLFIMYFYLFLFY